ncbi:MAG: N-acetyltransferase family protein [Limosilactobacillus pontis]|uniref:N-acetyltransferase n=1 Tax=Limosilactobacillus pontis TaxID=35787 RepID=A0A2J6NM77_9LACO|nr:GNAT family N-acetyltransferase [Limosilactobacillus pontis]PMB82430.1 N-acetyltransferase [Limosilactobacillus pontis]
MAINFRRARPDDLHAIVAIFNESVDLPINDEVELVTPASRREWLAAFNDDFPLWVAEQDKRVVAWCGLEPFYPHPAYRFTAEISIYVGRPAQGQGIGRRFLSLVDQQVQARLPIRTIVAYIYQGNQASQHLFATAGFTHWGRLHQVANLNGKFHDLLIYGKTY